MKKLLTICLLIAAAFTINAQDGKPTKEQTIEFIKSYFEGKEFGYSCIDQHEKTLYSEMGNFYSNFHITLVNNQLTIEYDTYNKWWVNNKPAYDSREKSKLIIDLSKSEAVSIFPGTPSSDCGKKENYLIIYAVFHSIPNHKNKYENNSKVTEDPFVYFPINVYKCNGCDNEAINKKILQAFNHLRKLCGAPEPISFDD